MVIVTYNATNYECMSAIKGNNYVHLLDANNNLIAAFDGVVDFSSFTIYGGDWSTPTPVDNSFIATVGDDKVIRASSRRGSDIPNIQISTTDITAGSSPLDTGKFYFVYE